MLVSLKLTTRKSINTNGNTEGIFPRDFTDGNIPSVYTEGITVEKKFKTKQKKNDDMSFFTNGITDGKFHR